MRKRIDRKTHLMFIRSQHLLQSVDSLFSPTVIFRAVMIRLMAAVGLKKPAKSEVEMADADGFTTETHAELIERRKKKRPAKAG